MRRRRSPQATRQQHSVFYPTDYAGGGPPFPVALQEMYTQMFIDDLARGLLPYRAQSRNADFRIGIEPTDRAREEMIAAALTRGERQGLASSLREFLRLLTSELFYTPRAIYEIALTNDPGANPQNGVDLVFIDERQVKEDAGGIYQIVPPEIAAARKVAERIPLPRESLIIFTLPPPMGRLISDVKATLSILSDQRFFEMALNAQKTGLPYNFTEHQRSMNLALAEVGKTIGWTARGTFNRATLSFHWIQMQLRFERFKLRLREALLGQLNTGLRRIEGPLGFSPEIKIFGLPTEADIDKASEQLSAGQSPFTEVMKPF